jgi:hypothetical protein
MAGDLRNVCAQLEVLEVDMPLRTFAVRSSIKRIDLGATH